MNERVRVREIDDDEGKRLVRTVRRALVGGDLLSGADGAALPQSMDVVSLAKLVL